MSQTIPWLLQASQLIQGPLFPFSNLQRRASLVSVMEAGNITAYSFRKEAQEDAFRAGVGCCCLDGTRKHGKHKLTQDRLQCLRVRTASRVRSHHWEVNGQRTDWEVTPRTDI